MVDVEAGGKCYEAVIPGYSGKLEGNLQEEWRRVSVGGSHS